MITWTEIIVVHRVMLHDIVAARGTWFENECLVVAVAAIVARQRGIDMITDCQPTVGLVVE